MALTLAIAGSVPRIQWLISPHRWLYPFAIFSKCQLEGNSGKIRSFKYLDNLGHIWALDEESYAKHRRKI